VQGPWHGTTLAMATTRTRVSCSTAGSTGTTRTTPARPVRPATHNSYPPIPGTWNCPSYAPIKGNQGSPEWIYHLPSNAYYANTNPEECFATEAAAVAAGYRPARV
jgi:hypothetical protein